MNSLNRLSEPRPTDAAGSYLAAQRSAADLPKDDAAVTTATSDDEVTLSQEALDAHAAGLARLSQDAAGALMQRFASALFGDGVQTKDIQFNAASIDVSSVFRAAATGSHNGSAAALSLADSAHFVGQGSIVTADGQRFDFEIEIQYDARITAAGGSSQGLPDTGTSLGTDPGVAASPGTGGVTPGPNLGAMADASAGSASPLQLLTGRQLPEIGYPGTLDDLFKVLGRDVAAQVRGQDGQGGGQFSLRLLRLVQTAALLAPRAQPEQDIARAAAYAGAQHNDATAPLAAA